MIEPLGEVRLGSGAESGGLDRFCGAALGTTTMTTLAALTATGTHPTIATTTLGFGCVLGLPTFVCPFFWSGCDGSQAACWASQTSAFQQCGPMACCVSSMVFARRGEGRGTAPDRSGPRARYGDTGASPAPGAYTTLGTVWLHSPPCRPQLEVVVNGSKPSAFA